MVTENCSSQRGESARGRTSRPRLASRKFEVVVKQEEFLIWIFWGCWMDGLLTTQVQTLFRHSVRKNRRDDC